MMDTSTLTSSNLFITSFVLAKLAIVRFVFEVKAGVTALDLLHQLTPLLGRLLYELRTGAESSTWYLSLSNRGREVLLVGVAFLAGWTRTIGLFKFCH